MRTFFLLPLLFLSSLTNAQEEARTFNLGAEVQYVDNLTSSSNFFGAITCGSGKHQVFLGPALFDAIEAPLFGLQGGYRFFPMGRENRANLFFEYNACFFHYKDKSRPTGDISEEIWRVTSLENDLSMGCRLNLFKGTYLSLAIGSGVLFTKERYRWVYMNGTEQKGRFTYFDAPGWPIDKVAFKFGIGYDFSTVRVGH